jgi:type IV secretion system protein TrbL
MKPWQKLALLAAAGAATAATAGAATPALAGGTSAIGAGAAGTGATGAAGTGLFNGGLLGGGKALIASGQTGILPGASSTMGLSAGAFNPASFGVGAPSTGGLLNTGITGSEVMGGLKGAGQAASSMAAVKNLFPDAPLQHAQMSQGSPAGPQTVAQIYQSSQQSVQDQINQAMQERMLRRKIWG